MTTDTILNAAVFLIDGTLMFGGFLIWFIVIGVIAKLYWKKLVN